MYLHIYIHIRIPLYYYKVIYARLPVEKKATLLYNMLLLYYSVL